MTKSTFVAAMAGTAGNGPRAVVGPRPRASRLPPTADGVLGMLPPLEGVDAATAHRTVLRVWQTWDWKRCWGWDFPWMAMAAARVGEPQIAVDALLKEAGNKNYYDPRGTNTGGPLPLPPRQRRIAL
jgi:hypothetical protein